MILGIQKQPTADTIALTKSIEDALVGLKASLPAGMEAPRVTFRQASFIEASITTLQGKLIGASIFVAVILFFFLGTLRPTIIALTAIPVSIFITALVFKYFGLSINTMTLGGLAIAIGGLVDDAVVGVENVLRRLKADRANHPHSRLHPIEIVAHATMEVRSAILYATVIIVLVFIPLFALPGLEGKLFVPLGIAFIVSTLASLIVSVTVTPVLSFYLLPRMKNLDHGDTKVLAWLKARYRSSLQGVLDRPKAAMAAAGAAVLVAAAAVPFFPTTFLPPFNEGTLLIGLRLNPGVTLTESSALARQAEVLVKQVPEVTHVGRRSGRAELDEHAEGVHVSELDVGLKPTAELTRSMDEIKADIRASAWSTCRPRWRSASRSRTASTTCSRACARRSPSRSLARTWTPCAARPTPCVRSWRPSPALPTCRSRSRCWHRRSRCASTTPRRRSTACRRRRCCRRCRRWSRARR